MQTLGGILLAASIGSLMGFSIIGLGDSILGHGIVDLKLISECEKSLPRNQHCKLIAVPETER